MSMSRYLTNLFALDTSQTPTDAMLLVISKSKSPTVILKFQLRKYS